MTRRRQRSQAIQPVQHTQNVPEISAQQGQSDDHKAVPTQFLAWLSQWRLVLLIPLWALLRGWNLFFLSPEQDTQRYFDAASQWLLGRIPYAQFQLEYPPGALPLFALPRYFTQLVLHNQQELSVAFRRFSHIFAAEMVAFDLLAMWLIAQMSYLLMPVLDPTTAKHSHDRRRAVLTLAMGVYIVMVSCLGKMAFQRFDMVFGTLIIAFLHAAMRPKWRYTADILLALSVWVKVISLPLVPFYLGYLWLDDHRSCGHDSRPTWRDGLGWLMRRGSRHIAIISLGLCCFFGPFFYQAGMAMLSFVAYHANRGLQIESTYASAFMMLHKIFGLELQRRFAFGASEVMHSSSQNIAHASGAIMILFTLLLLAAWLPRQMASRGLVAQRRGFIEGALACMLGILFTNKVFSPQFLFWVAPLSACLVLTQKKRWTHDLLALCTAYAVTCLIVMFYYMDMLQFHALPISLLFLRNLIVGSLAWSLAGLPTPTDLKNARNTSAAFLSRPKVQKSLGYASIALCSLWVFAANMSETTANDIWIQLRSGADIWHSRSLPYTEVYSATVSGRPFIAHEWLSGVLFFVSDMLLGDMGLSLLTALTALAIFAVLYFAFEKQKRATFWYMPLLLYVNYLVAFRLLARPHIFTILAQAMLITAIERWRRSGRALPLAWLIPMQVVWINLHGAALFGPALMAMISGCTLLMVWLPQLAQSESRAFSYADVRKTSLVTLGMAVACLINPYGIKIVTFSLDLMGNEYAKNRVWEWTTPFLPMNVYYYWLYIFIALFVAVWASLMWRIRKLPLLDLAYTILASYLGLRANRFMPDFAILSFPVIVRSFASMADYALPKRLRGPRPWVDLALATLLFCNCAVYGYAHSGREHRPLFGWGYGGDMPFVEVDLLKKLGIKGTIYNEYSDGSLIINRLVPNIKPVLDSRIDLYPLDFVDEYDRAYLNPQLFAQFLQQHSCNIVMLYKNRTSPAVLQYLDQASAWRRLLDTNGRVLYVTHASLAAARH